MTHLESVPIDAALASAKAHLCTPANDLKLVEGHPVSVHAVLPLVSDRALSLSDLTMFLAIGEVPGWSHPLEFES